MIERPGLTIPADDEGETMRNYTPPLLLLLPVLLLMPLAPGAAEASDKPSQKAIEKIAAARKAAKNLELLYQSIGLMG